MGKKAVSIEIRNQIVGAWKTKTKSNVAIAKMFNVTEKCVRTTVANYMESGRANEKPRSGRPTKHTERDRNKIYRMVRKDPKLWSSAR